MYAMPKTFSRKRLPTLNKLPFILSPGAKKLTRAGGMRRDGLGKQILACGSLGPRKHGRQQRDTTNRPSHCSCHDSFSMMDCILCTAIYSKPRSLAAVCVRYSVREIQTVAPLLSTVFLKSWAPRLSKGPGFTPNLLRPGSEARKIF